VIGIGSVSVFIAAVCQRGCCLFESLAAGLEGYVCDDGSRIVALPIVHYSEPIQLLPCIAHITPCTLQNWSHAIMGCAQLKSCVACDPSPGSFLDICGDTSWSGCRSLWWRQGRSGCGCASMHDRIYFHADQACV